MSRVITLNIEKAFQSRNTLFAVTLFQSPPGVLPANTLKHCSPSAVRCWIRAIGGLLPLANYLHRIGRATSCTCPYCPAPVETLAHFACSCPQFRDARTKAHDIAWQHITQCIQRYLPLDWSLMVETPLAATGLHIQPVHLPSQESIPRDSGNNISIGAQPCDLGRWRPDAIVISHTRKKIGILDLSRCSDSSPGSLSAANTAKLTK